MTNETPKPPPAAERADVSPDLPLAHLHAMRSLALSNLPFDENLTADAMLNELHRAFVADGDCEDLLFLHAQVLDSMFHRVLANALTHWNSKAGKNVNYVSGSTLELALRVQSQSRHTIGALTRLKAQKNKKTKQTK